MMKRIFFLWALLSCLIRPQISNAMFGQSILSADLQKAFYVFNEFIADSSCNPKSCFEQADDAAKAILFLSNPEYNSYAVSPTDKSNGEAVENSKYWACRKTEADEYIAKCAAIATLAENDLGLRIAELDKSLPALSSSNSSGSNESQYLNELNKFLGDPKLKSAPVTIDKKREALKYHAAVKFQRRVDAKGFFSAASDSNIYGDQSCHMKDLSSGFKDESDVLYTPMQYEVKASDGTLVGICPILQDDFYVTMLSEQSKPVYSYCEYNNVDKPCINPKVAKYAPNNEWKYTLMSLHNILGQKLGQFATSHKVLGSAVVLLAGYGAYKAIEKVFTTVCGCGDNPEAESADGDDDY